MRKLKRKLKMAKIALSASALLLASALPSVQAYDGGGANASTNVGRGLTLHAVGATANREGSANLRVSSTATHGVIAIGARATMNTGAASNWSQNSNANGTNLASGATTTTTTVVASRRNNVTLTGQYRYRRQGDGTSWRNLPNLTHTWQ